MVKSQILTRFTISKNVKIKIMSKGSGGNRASSSGKASATSGAVGSLAKEASKLGISASSVNMFDRAASYSSYQSAPASFVKEFNDNASQKIMNMVNNAEVKARAKMEAKVEKAFETGNKAAYNAAHAEYENTMASVRKYADRLRDIQSKFNRSK